MRNLFSLLIRTTNTHTTNLRITMNTTMILSTQTHIITTDGIQAVIVATTITTTIPTLLSLHLITRSRMLRSRKHLPVVISKQLALEILIERH